MTAADKYRGYLKGFSALDAGKTAANIMFDYRLYDKDGQVITKAILPPIARHLTSLGLKWALPTMEPLKNNFSTPKL